MGKDKKGRTSFTHEKIITKLHKVVNKYRKIDAMAISSPESLDIPINCLCFMALSSRDAI